MQVKANAEEVGLRTTSAVVMAIFTVIVLDAFFAVFFTEVGWGKDDEPRPEGEDVLIRVRDLCNAFGPHVVHEHLDLDVRRARSSVSSVVRAPASRC
jgi:hypothetical protein